MKVPVYDLTGKVNSYVDVNRLFSEPVRKDLIKKAVLAEQSAERQRYGADPEAGKKTSAHYHGRRGIKNSMMNREMARMKRIHGSGHLSFRARFVPQAVKGRKAHPPKAEKNWVHKINKKEHMKALLSALRAGTERDIVAERGHKIEEVKHFPLVFDDSFEKLKKIKEVRDALNHVGLKEEMERVKEKKIRSGRGKTRGRKYKRKKGPIVIVKNDETIKKAGRNLSGFDILTTKELSVQALAPGTQPGRLCIWTKSALSDMDSLKS
ncbi:MAG: 50S ribosomal protein L4 [Nanoarchaeota archaeon]|nr:50S ribosomal protein L4 [Nanoarchaeota archaeon]